MPMYTYNLGRRSDRRVLKAKVCCKVESPVKLAQHLVFTQEYRIMTYHSILSDKVYNK